MCMFLDPERLCVRDLKESHFFRLSANFGKFNLECQGWLGMGQTTPVSVQWTGSGLEVGRKWAGSGPEVDPSVLLSVCLSVCLHFPCLLDKPYARDLKAQGAYSLRFFDLDALASPATLLKCLAHVWVKCNLWPFLH